MKKSTIQILIGLLILLVLPRIVGGLMNIVGILLAIGLLFVLFNENLRKRLTQLWKIYHKTKRK